MDVGCCCSGKYRTPRLCVLAVGIAGSVEWQQPLTCLSGILSPRGEEKVGISNYGANNGIEN